MLEKNPSLVGVGNETDHKNTELFTYMCVCVCSRVLMIALLFWCMYVVVRVCVKEVQRHLTLPLIPVLIKGTWQTYSKQIEILAVVVSNKRTFIWEYYENAVTATAAKLLSSHSVATHHANLRTILRKHGYDPRPQVSRQMPRVGLKWVGRCCLSIVTLGHAYPLSRLSVHHLLRNSRRKLSRKRNSFLPNHWPLFYLPTQSLTFILTENQWTLLKLTNTTKKLNSTSTTKTKKQTSKLTN